MNDVVVHPLGERDQGALIPVSEPIVCVRRYLAYPLSDRHPANRMAERGVDVDHSNLDRWVPKFAPQVEAAFRKGRKRPVGQSWRMDETDIKIKGTWTYLYRAIDKHGHTIDFFLTAQRDQKAALRLLKKAVRQHGLSEKVTIDQSGAHTAALEALQEDTGTEIEIRQSQYLNNGVEQDHRAVKRIVRPMLGFQSFHSARTTLQGIELMHRLKKGQMVAAGGRGLSAADQFYSLAAEFRPEIGPLCQSVINATQPVRFRFLTVSGVSTDRSLSSDCPSSAPRDKQQIHDFRSPCPGEAAAESPVRPSLELGPSSVDRRRARDSEQPSNPDISPQGGSAQP